MLCLLFLSDSVRRDENFLLVLVTATGTSFGRFPTDAERTSLASAAIGSTRRRQRQGSENLKGRLSIAILNKVTTFTEGR